MTLTGLKKGTATVTVTATFSGNRTYSANAKVSVWPSYTVTDFYFVDWTDSVSGYENVAYVKTPLDLSGKLRITYTTDNSQTNAVAPEDPRNDWDITWSVSNTKVASITQDGVLTIKQADETIVVYALLDYTDNDEDVQRVASVVVTSLEGNPITKLTTNSAKTVPLDLGSDTEQSATLAVSYTTKYGYADGYDWYDKDAGLIVTTDEITWSVKNENIATVTGDGITATVTAVGVGKTTVTATSSSGKKASFTVTVKATLKSIEEVIADDDDNVLYAGQSTQLSVTKDPAANTDKVTYTVSDNAKKYVKVNSKGVLSVAKNLPADLDGATVTISAKSGEKESKENLEITVKKSTFNYGLSKLTFTKNKLSVYAGSKFGFSAAEEYMDLSNEILEKINEVGTWASSKPSVATVDEEGNVTPVSAGTTVISVNVVTAAGKSLTAKMTLTVKPVLESMTMKADEISVIAGTTKKITAQVTLPKGSTETVNWSSNVDWLTPVKTTGTKVTFNVDLTKASLGDTAVITAVAKTGNVRTGLTNQSVVAQATVTVVNKTTKITSSRTKATVNLSVVNKITYDINTRCGISVVSAAAGDTEYKADCDEQLTYTSSNTSVATVSSAGIVRFKTAGKVTITAKVPSGKSVKITFTVK